MPGLGDVLQQYFPAMGAFLPKLTGNQVTSDEGSDTFGKGGLYGPQNVGKQYLNFLRTKEIERSMTPIARKMKEFQVNLATKINQQRFGMSPEEAEQAAYGPSMGSMLAWGMLKANGVDKMLESAEDTMRKAGVYSPIVAPGLAGRATMARNRRASAFMDHTVNVLMNPKNTNKMGAINAPDAANVIFQQFLNGSFNHIISDPYSFDRRGNFSRKAKESLFKSMSGYTKAASEMGDFLGVPPGAAMPTAISKLGFDPIKTLGMDKTVEMFRNLRGSAEIAGISDEQMGQLLGQAKQIYATTGSPESALANTQNFILAAAAGKGQDMRGLDKGQVNSSLFSKIKQSSNSLGSQLLATSYAALTDLYGEKRAKSMVDHVKKNSKNFRSVKGFLGAINRRLPASDWLSKDTLRNYLDSDVAKKYTAMGSGTLNILSHQATKLLSQREKALKKLGYNYQDIEEMKSMGGLTQTGVEKYINSKPFANASARRGQLSKINQLFSNISVQAGFQNNRLADNFIATAQKTPEMKQMREHIQGRTRIEKALERRGKRSGIRGLQDTILADKGKYSDWISGVLGKDRDITAKDMSQLHQVSNSPELKNDFNSSWSNVFGPIVAPEEHSSQNRRKALDLIVGR